MVRGLEALVFVESQSAGIGFGDGEGEGGDAAAGGVGGAVVEEVAAETGVLQAGVDAELRDVGGVGAYA